MNPYDEIDMLMEKLTAMWGSVNVACDGKTCVVGDGIGREFEAPTLLEALRMAVDEGI